MSDKDEKTPEADEPKGIEIPEVPENLSDLTDEKLSGLHSTVLEFITDSDKAVEVLKAHPGSEGKEIMEGLFSAEGDIKTVIDERAAKAKAEADALKMVADRAAAEAAAKAEAEAAAKAEAEKAAAEAQEAENAPSEESEQEVSAEETVEDQPVADDAEIGGETPVAEEVSGEVNDPQSDPGDEDGNAPVAEDREAELVAAAVKAALEAVGVTGENAELTPARSEKADPAMVEVEQVGTVSITAAGHAGGVAPGSEYDSVDHFLQVLNDSGSRASEGNALGRQEIGTMVTDVPEEYRMSPEDAEGNAKKMRSIAAAKIAEVTQTEDSIAAAACGQLCAPCEPIFDNLGLCLPENRSYIENAFPFVNSARGKYKWVGNPIAVDADGNEVGWDYGVGDCIENCADDAWVKPCVEIACPEGESCEITPIPACLKVDNLLSKTWDEGRQYAMARLMAEHTAFKDQFLLAQIEHWASPAGGGSTVTIGSKGGAYGSVPYNMALILEQYVQMHRLDRTGCPLHLLVPDWLRTSRQLDLLLGMFRCECSGDSIGMFSGTDLVARVDFYRHPFPDGAPTVAPGCENNPGAPKANPMAAHDWYTYDCADGTEIPCLPDTARIYVLGPVGNIFGQTMGRMTWTNVLSEDDLAKNCYRTMIEDFLGLCKTGGFPVKAVDMGICADGSVTGTIEPACCS